MYGMAANLGFGRWLFAAKKPTFHGRRKSQNWDYGEERKKHQERTRRTKSAKIKVEILIFHSGFYDLEHKEEKLGKKKLG